MIQIDEIGILYDTTEESSVALPGYHVNATHPVVEWAGYQVTPATPRRIFGGIPTYFYSFASQAEYGSIPANLDIEIMPVPQSVSIRQGCQALEQAGLLASVEAAIASSPRYVQIDWQRATSIDRTWPTLAVLQQALGLTDTQIDDLFIAAANL